MRSRAPIELSLTTYVSASSERTLHAGKAILNLAIGGHLLAFTREGATREAFLQGGFLRLLRACRNVWSGGSCLMATIIASTDINA